MSNIRKYLVIIVVCMLSFSMIAPAVTAQSDGSTDDSSSDQTQEDDTSSEDGESDSSSDGTDINVNTNEEDTSNQVIKQFDESDITIRSIDENQNRWVVEVYTENRTNKLEVMKVIEEPWITESRMIYLNDGVTEIVIEKDGNPTAVIYREGQDYYELKGTGGTWFSTQASPIYTFFLGMGVFVIAIVSMVKYRRKKERNKREQII